MDLLLPPEDKGNCHIVILVPGIQDIPVTNSVNWNRPMMPYALYDESFGDKLTWNYPFDQIARSKAFQLWHDQNDGRGPTPAHLLLPGDTPYWGGVKREGIVVSCSGFDEADDRMAAGMIAEICIALAKRKFASSEDKRKGVNFLS